MTTELKPYYKWFENYTEKFLSCKDAKIRINYELKREHTHRVVENILKIGRGLRLNENSLMLCELIGLFHDVGRFKQYSEYGTFSDAITGSHGKLSIEVLLEHEVLEKLSDREKEIIIKSIDYHTSFSVPDTETEEIKSYSRLIRDADKLDAFYLGTAKGENRKYDLGELSSERDYSEEVIKDIMSSRQVDFRNIKYKYDRELAMVGFIFDLFYKESYAVFQAEDYLAKMFAALPQSEEMRRVYVHCENYIGGRMAV